MRRRQQPQHGLAIALKPIVTIGRAGLAAAAAMAILAGCGTTVVSSGAKPAPTATPDVVAARTAALTIYYAAPGQTPPSLAPVLGPARTAAAELLPSP